MPMSLRSEKGRSEADHRDSDASSVASSRTSMTDDTARLMLRQMDELRKALFASQAQLAALHAAAAPVCPPAAAESAAPSGGITPTGESSNILKVNCVEPPGPQKSVNVSADAQQIAEIILVVPPNPQTSVNVSADAQRLQANFAVPPGQQTSVNVSADAQKVLTEPLGPNSVYTRAEQLTGNHIESVRWTAPARSTDVLRVRGDPGTVNSEMQIETDGMYRVPAFNATDTRRIVRAPVDGMFRVPTASAAANSRFSLPEPTDGMYRVATTDARYNVAAHIDDSHRVTAPSYANDTRYYVETPGAVKLGVPAQPHAEFQMETPNMNCYDRYRVPAPTSAYPLDSTVVNNNLNMNNLEENIHSSAPNGVAVLNNTVVNNCATSHPPRGVYEQGNKSRGQVNSNNNNNNASNNITAMQNSGLMTKNNEVWPSAPNVNPARVSDTQEWVEAAARRPQYDDVPHHGYGGRERDSEWRDNVLARQTGVRDLPVFDGNPAEWQGFKLIFEETTKTFGWTDAENRARLNHALRGEARRVVGPTLYWSGPGAAVRVMAALDEHYGGSNTAEAVVKDLLQRFKPRSLSTVSLEEVHEFCLLVDNAVSTLAPVGNGRLLSDQRMLGQFLEKMPTWECVKWADANEGRRGERSLLELSEFYHSWRETLKNAGFVREQRMPKTKSRPVMNAYANYVDENEKAAPRPGERPTNPPQKVTKTMGCTICSKHHSKGPAKCSEYHAKTVQERWNIVKKKRLCFACLSSKHSSNKCLLRCTIDGCGKPHHRTLHTAIITNETVTNTWRTELPVLLKVLPVTVVGPLGERQIYALLDEGSTVTLLDEEVARDIGATGRSTILRLSGVQNMSTTKVASMRVKAKVRGDGPTYAIQANTLHDLRLPKQIVATSRQQLRNPGEPVTPKMLIGQDNAHLIVSRELREHAGDPTVLSRTALGWTTHGGTCEVAEIAVALCIRRDEELDKLVRGHFAVDSLGVTAAQRTSAAEERAIKLMRQTSRPTEDGRWETGLLWERDDSRLPENREAAMKRLLSLERKLAKDPILAAAYKLKMTDYVIKGYARPIEDGEYEEGAGRNWYLPHFAVQNKPGKIRIVFDAAAEYRGVSLNKRLLTGPDLLSSLVGNILRFREGKVGVAADIQDMFLRIKLKKEDQMSQLFLWRDQPEMPPTTYVFTSVIFGAKCSPASAQFIRNEVAESQRKVFPVAADTIKNRFYMDDYLDAAHSSQEASQKAQEVRQALLAGGFRLVNWASNDPAVFQAVPSEERAKSLINIGGPDQAQERILGVKWDPANDVFVCQWSQTRDMAWPTKRGLLASVMRVFDPMGFIACLTVQAKILLQDVWRNKTGWDEKLTEEHAMRWKHWLDAVEAARTEIPRCCRFYKNSERYLHVFADASEQACCAVAYLVERPTEGGAAKVSFLGAKTKVAPLRPVSIPRLELQAALMAARFAATIRKEMASPVTKTWYWSDSTTVLQWIRTDPRTHTAFVANRLGEIDEITSLHDWRWVPTKLNPADIATRDGDLPDLRPDGLWFQGPAFIVEGEKTWPEDKTVLQRDVAETFVGRVMIDTPTILDPNRFSSWSRLLRVTAWVQRFVESCRGHKYRGALRAEDLLRAENLWAKLEQRRAFPKDMAMLTRNEEVGQDSRLANLTPFLDTFGLLRMRSRVQALPLDEEGLVLPIILDGDRPYTRLLIRHRHEIAGHISAEKTVAELRRDLAVLKLRGAVRLVVSKCLRCRQDKAMPAPPLMGSLPEARLAFKQRPFTHCGVDFFGPMTVVIGRRHEKRYGALFTCLTTRAVHLELVHSLETDAMIMALRRMTARRGNPKIIYSDNGTNFHGADRELRGAIEEVLADEKLKDKLAGDRTEWRFIPPSSPHMGGAWERLVRSVKEALRKTLGNQILKQETLLTALAEAEHTLNSRPLTHISTDPNDEEPLTPNHFLIGSPSGRPCLAYYGPEADDVCLRRQWRLAQQLADKFWRRWLREYVPSLRQRNKWKTTATPIKKGDLVWVLDPSQPRNVWPKGVVTETAVAADGQVRSAEIRTSTGVYTRPATKLIVIPVGEMPSGTSGEAERSRGECTERH